jgi:hypothetical protein
MSNTVIRAAMESRLKAWADAQSPKTLVAYQNVSFSKPADFTPYLECTLIPNETQDRDVACTQKRYMGFFQVNCWAQKGKGMGQAERLAESVITLFPRTLNLDPVRIDATPSAGKPLSDDSGWVIVPVLIKYRLDT